MGQYYLICDLDKKQYLHPHKFGEGLKLMEFGSSGGGSMLALAVLLADSNGRGGGDLPSKNPIVGSWAGDRIVVTGDYADKGRWEPESEPLFIIASEHWEDISDQVLLALCDDAPTLQDLREALRNRLPGGYAAESLTLLPELAARLKG